MSHLTKSRFLRLIPSAPLPVRANSSAAGTMPIRAFRYCEPIRLATSFGWYLFPPTNFSVIWDGTITRWKCDGIDEWMQLDAAQFPRFSKQFDEAAPEDVKGYSPPFISAVLQPGVFQLWSGYILTTPPGMSAYVRSPINLPQMRHATSFEGVIETDRWFGPLFSNFQIKRINEEVLFRRSEPMFSVAIVPTSLFKNSSLQEAEVVESMGGMGEEDWDDYRATIVNRVGEHRKQGSYAVNSRKAA